MGFNLCIFISCLKYKFQMSVISAEGSTARTVEISVEQVLSRTGLVNISEEVSLGNLFCALVEYYQSDFSEVF